jgi:hypothetical protein
MLNLRIESEPSESPCVAATALKSVHQNDAVLCGFAAHHWKKYIFLCYRVISVLLRGILYNSRLFNGFNNYSVLTDPLLM